MPVYDFDDKFVKFSFRTLLTLGEVITALTRVRTECNKVAAMTLFQAPISKSMRLEEFEQAQGQTSSQVCFEIIRVLEHLKSENNPFN